MKNTKVIMDSVVDDFNIIVNEGFTARHEVLNRESSVDAAKLNQALGISSSNDYRARYIALLTCVVDYIDKSESMCHEIVDNIRGEIELLNHMVDDLD